MRPSLGAPRKKWMGNRWRRRRGEGAQVKQVKREKNTHNDGQEKNSLAVDKY